MQSHQFDPTTLSLFVACLIGVGATFVLGSGFMWWRGRQPLVGDWAVKIIAKIVQLAAGYVAVTSSYESGAAKAEWERPAILAIVCILVWEAASILTDAWLKHTDRVDRKTIARLTSVVKGRTELLTAFRNLVNEKILKLEKAITRDGGPKSAQARALAPDDHFDGLLARLAFLLDKRLPSETGTANFRVGLYVLHDDEVMRPAGMVNGNNPSYNVFKSFQKHEGAFHLKCDGQPSLVVDCVRKRKTLIVEDCLEAQKKGEFTFFNEDQRGYLRSMIAFFLDAVCTPEGKMTQGVLMVDTDSPRYFRESRRDRLEFCMREFGSRIKLESLLRAILKKRGKAQ